jgi:predicted ATPase/DNA-binding SARP family transcriptional activator
MTGELQLMLLGKPRYTFTDAPTNAPAVDFLYKKSLALLAFLASTRQPQSRETLAGMLWAEMPEEHARANLRKVLTDLRHGLAPFLTITRQAVAFNGAAPYALDVEAFETKLRALKSAGDPGLLGESTIQQLSEAVELYTGDFMDGYYIHDAPAFEEWVTLQREHFRQLQLTALHTLAKYHTARGAYTPGIAFTGKLLALEPWHEESHQQMMLLLALTGQRSAALHQYEMCRDILEKELGVVPSRDTTALYRQIQSGELSAPPSRAVPPHNLLAQVTPFVGRETELQTIAGRLNDPECRLLTLVGIPGAGKSRLALQAASAALGLFADGVFRVRTELAPGSDLLRCIADGLGLCLEQGGNPEEQLLDNLRHKQLLLVLDNAELLGSRAEFLLEVLQHAPGVKWLLTSLERLGLPGEWVLPVGGLVVPHSQSAEEIDSSSAVQLFATYACRAEADFMLSEENRAAIVRICQLVEGLPLAIELAAAWARVLPCQEIAQEIERNIDFLATSSKSVPERHCSLRAVFAYSWAHLSKEEQEVFARLSVFKGGFSRDAAEQVAGASLRILASLLDRCLIQKSSLGRYDVHEFLREYGAQELAENQEQDEEVHNRHGLYFAAFVSQRGAQLAGPRQREALNEIAGELENIKAAQRWSSQQISTAPGGSRANGESASRTQYRRHQKDERLFEQAIRQVYKLLEQRARMAGQIAVPA